jgi:hypothetical protein
MIANQISVQNRALKDALFYLFLAADVDNSMFDRNIKVGYNGYVGVESGGKW